jgi:transposase
MDMALSGRPVEEAAASANVVPHSVKHWLRMVRQRGIVDVLEAWEPPVKARKLSADAMALRELAAKERSPRIRKRFLALADLADGKCIHDASMSSGMSHPAIEKWIGRFEEGGAAAIRKERGRPSKLSQAQLEELRACLWEQPNMKRARNCDT